MAALWGDHSLRPLRFSLSINFLLPPLHRHLHLLRCFHAHSVCSKGTSSGGTNIADTTCTTHTPFLRKIALSVMFHTTIETWLATSCEHGVSACITCSPGGSGQTLPLIPCQCMPDRHYHYSAVSFVQALMQLFLSKSLLEMGPHRHCFSSP